MAKRTQNDEIFRLTQICEGLAADVSQLQSRVAELEARVSELTEGDADGTYPDSDEEEAETPRGRPPLKPAPELEHRRDFILRFLQSHWEEVERFIKNANSAYALQGALLDRFSSLKDQEPGLAILLKHPEELWSFIAKSGRYYGDAIALASAMAGVPDMEPRTSHDHLLAKKNANKFHAIHHGEMKARQRRISASKAGRRASD